MKRAVEEQEGVGSIGGETGLDQDVGRGVRRQVDQNEDERRRGRPGPRVTEKAFGIGRRIPIVMEWDREAMEALAAEEPVSNL